MALQSKTRQIIETSIDRKQNFDRGNVSGKWVYRGYYRSDSTIAELPREFVKLLNKHSLGSDLFVVYSYRTPIAWFSLSESDSNGNNKWYYVDHKYSSSTTGHQSAVRYALKGKNVITLSTDENGKVVESEKEYY